MTNDRESGIASLNFLQHIRGEYFQWLCEKVLINKGDDSYYILANTLHHKEFTQFVPNDENRAADGVELRKDYAREETSNDLEEHAVLDILSGPCTMFEMLIALAERISFILSETRESDTTAERFWEMIDNIDLGGMTDALYFERGGSTKVGRTIEMVLNRTYDKRGRGGLFPLKRCKEDQRRVELWYQMSAYLEENHRIPD